MSLAKELRAERKAGGLPDGVELGLDFYVVSDEAGIETVFSVKGLPAAPDWFQTPTLDPLKILSSIGQPIATFESIADDWRMMTRPEIADYKRRQREEEIEDRRRAAEDLDEDD